MQPKRRRSTAEPTLGGPSRRRTAHPTQPTLVEESEPEEEPVVRKVGRPKKAVRVFYLSCSETWSNPWVFRLPPQAHRPDASLGRLQRTRNPVGKITMSSSREQSPLRFAHPRFARGHVSPLLARGPSRNHASRCLRRPKYPHLRPKTRARHGSFHL